MEVVEQNADYWQKIAQDNQKQLNGLRMNLDIVTREMSEIKSQNTKLINIIYELVVNK